MHVFVEFGTLHYVKGALAVCSSHTSSEAISGVGARDRAGTLLCSILRDLDEIISLQQTD